MPRKENQAAQADSSRSFESQAAKSTTSSWSVCIALVITFCEIAGVLLDRAKSPFARPYGHFYNHYVRKVLMTMRRFFFNETM